MNNSERKNKIVAVIPFYNEKEFIFDVVSKTLDYVDLVIAVDDGSTDNSSECLKTFENVLIIRNDKNMGKGHALERGFDLARSIDFDILFTIDGDGQHKVEIIPEFLKCLNNNDVVIGNRLNDLSDMPFHRILSNKITSYLISKKLGVKILDSQCGFRAYKKEVISFVRTKYKGFEAESEIIVNIVRKNFRIGFVDIPTIYENQRSKMKPLEAISGFIKVLLM